MESLLDDLGGCGLFQILMVILVQGAGISGACNYMFLVFGSYDPGWSCQDQDALNDNVSYISLNHNATSNDTNDEVEFCHAYKHCTNGVFDNDSSTILTEWNLECDKLWVLSLMISLEIGGGLFGSIIGGHLSFYIGRKACHFGVMLFNALINFIAIFASNWQSYAAIRCLIGVGSGSLVINAYVLPIEFLTGNWRGVYAALPFWNIGFLFFAVVAMLLRDWKKLHIVLSIVSLLWCLPVFWAPDSLRWLIVKGKHLKAQRVTMKIAKVNGRRMSVTVDMNTIAQHDVEEKAQQRMYTIFDLYRHGFLLQTIVLTFACFALSFVYLVTFYGMKTIAGDFYVNMMVFSFITAASYLFVPILSSTVGRKLGILIFLAITMLCCVAFLCSRYLRDLIDEGLLVSIVSFLLLSCIDGAWALLFILAVELYPTELRSLSFSHIGLLAKIGSMMTPFFVPNGDQSRFVIYIVFCVMILTTCIVVPLLQETKGKPMVDWIKPPNDNTNSTNSNDVDTEENDDRAEMI